MFNASIVLYNTDIVQLEHVVSRLLEVGGLRRVYLIDNSPLPLDKQPFFTEQVEYVYTGRNLGYGAGHNIALRKSLAENIPFHLVLNADISFAAADIERMLGYMQAHEEVGSMMPKVVYPSGELQYLCKLLPTPIDLFGRRFMPDSWFRHRTERYELRFTGYDHIMNVPYLSGCFMLLSCKALLRTGMFDERFFMYPEDIDLTRRLHREYLTLYYPEATIVHHHERASYKNKRLLWVHVVNVCRYFCKYGWLLDKERDRMNKATLSAVGK